MLETMLSTKDSARLELTDQEHHEVDELTATLVTAAPALVDETEWLDVARTLSCRLPVRLRETLREFRHDPGLGGVLLLRNLPVGAGRLPPTPTRPLSVERLATTASATSVLVAMQLGEPAAYRNEKFGALVQNVVPVPGQEDRQSNAGSTPLEMHIENAFHPHRPDFVSLLCLRADHEGVAALLVASVRHALQLLTPEVTKVLAEPRFRTEPPPSFEDRADGAIAHPVLLGDVDDPNIRIDFNSTHPVDEQAREAMARLREAFTTVWQAFHLQSGDMAVVDNRITIHGRTAFTPSYDGHDRWLHRTFVHLDNRRTRVARANGGHVLD